MSHTPYNGPSRKLVLAFDIGTTYSGAAYAFLDPGEVPQITPVTKCVLRLYHPTVVRSLEQISEQPKRRIVKGSINLVLRSKRNLSGCRERDWALRGRKPPPDAMVRNTAILTFPSSHSHRWKLILGPTEPPTAMKNQMSTELPMGKTIVDVFSDFMSYLFTSTKALFVSSDQNGRLRWNSASRNIELVLTHPNGWGGLEQSELRTAAIQANIVPDTPEGHARVHFVTEGEASFNFCATYTRVGENLKV